MYAWLLDPFLYGDRRLPHRSYPPKYLEIGELQRLSNISYFKVDLDDLMATTKRMSILRHDYKIVHTDVFRIDYNELKNQEQLLDDMYKPKETEILIHLVTGGDIYYDLLIQNNNEVTACFEPDDEDQSWIRILLSRGDLIIIPKGQIYRSTTTGNNFVRVKRFHQHR
ncbi:1,2-dihydroxy-3-keto-5-methylthiopentene dioxygenase-like protein [Aphelenchoides bicaudatus]|nr:1,2-dihydroxy-3-keto-5-methylthiopentene dioxygenase-like protein [Aphelenchoides bicaudatus]